MSSKKWSIGEQWPKGFGLRERPTPAAPLTFDSRQLEWGDVIAASTASSLPIVRPPLENLRDVLVRSRFRRREFASWVLGCHERTLDRYLAGDRIPEDRSNWLRRLEAVASHGDRVLIVIRALPVLAPG